MIDASKQRWAIVAVVHYLTLFFLGQANHYLAPLGIQIFALGMLLSFSALELTYKQGLLSLLPIALFLDSKSPLPFGFSLLFIAALYTLAHIARSRVRREISASRFATSILLNIAAFLGYTIAAARSLGSESLHLGPLALNLLAGLLVVALLNRIYFDCQTGTLSLFGIDLAAEQRQAR